jgi:hypothetical protein
MPSCAALVELLLRVVCHSLALLLLLLLTLFFPFSFFSFLSSFFDLLDAGSLIVESLHTASAVAAVAASKKFWTLFEIRSSIEAGERLVDRP